MKKLFCLVMSLIMALSAFMCTSFSAYADEAEDIPSLELNKVYEAAFDATDDYSKSTKKYYDYFQFTMPANGKLTLKITSSFKGYKSQYVRYYILSAKGKGTWSPDNKKFKGKWSVNLKKGNYYFIAEYTKTNKAAGKMLGGSYFFKLSYSTQIDKVQAKKATSAASAFKLTWKKTKGAASYVVEYSTNKKFKDAQQLELAGAKTVKATVKELESGKTYYVRVRGFKAIKIGETTKTYYGKWSKTMKVKTK